MTVCEINEEFSELKEFIKSIPNRFYQTGEIILDSRNVVKKVSTGHGTFVIKNFKGMYFFNRLAYTLFRKSKAERSYLYSLTLLSKGIQVPAPVAWIDCYRWGMLRRSYYISQFQPYPTLAQLVNSPSGMDLETKNMLYRSLAGFAKNLHSHEIYHDDFSSGNILVIESSKSFSFALVDLNRILFKKVSYADGLQNFSKLGLPKAELNVVIQEYASLSRQPVDQSVNNFWKIRERIDFIRKVRKNLRKYTLTPIEKLFALRCLMLVSDGLFTII